MAQKSVYRLGGESVLTEGTLTRDVLRRDAAARKETVGVLVFSYFFLAVFGTIGLLNIRRQPGFGLLFLLFGLLFAVAFTAQYVRKKKAAEATAVKIDRGDYALAECEVSNQRVESHRDDGHTYYNRYADYRRKDDGQTEYTLEISEETYDATVPGDAYYVLLVDGRPINCYRASRYTLDAELQRKLEGREGAAPGEGEPVRTAGAGTETEIEIELPDGDDRAAAEISIAKAKRWLFANAGVNTAALIAAVLCVLPGTALHRGFGSLEDSMKFFTVAAAILCLFPLTGWMNVRMNRCIVSAHKQYPRGKFATEQMKPYLFLARLPGIFTTASVILLFLALGVFRFG